MGAKAFLLTVIDSDIQDRLIFLGRVASDAYMEVGTIALRICNRLDEIKRDSITGKLYLPPGQADTLKETGYMDVYRVVGELFGKSGRRVREYAQAVQFYPAQAWTEFEVLPFSHFEFALTFGEKWRTVLEASLLHMDRNGGRPPSVDWLQANFSGACQVGVDVNRIDAQNELEDARIYDNDVLSPDFPTAVEIDPKERYALRLIAKMAAALEKLMNTASLPPRVCRAISELADALRECLTVDPR